MKKGQFNTISEINQKRHKICIFKKKADKEYEDLDYHENDYSSNADIYSITEVRNSNGVSSKAASSQYNLEEDSPHSKENKRRKAEKSKDLRAFSPNKKFSEDYYQESVYSSPKVKYKSAKRIHVKNNLRYSTIVRQL